jgi:hypothetical protein
MGKFSATSAGLARSISWELLQSFGISEGLYFRRPAIQKVCISEGFAMFLKNVCAVVIAATLLAWNALASADPYRPDEFLSLDLSSAVLSPKPLGPASQFAPVAVEAKTDRGNEGSPARMEHVVHPKIRLAHVRREKRRVAHAGLARSQRNPLDAQAFDVQAFDARIQVWPCQSGGICNWRPRGN